MEKPKEKKRIQMKKNQEKGITLIALVITIIVLLILAGVTIAALAGDNGILSRATDAREATDIAEEKEKLALAAQAALIDNNGREILQQDLDKELEKGFGKNKYSVEEGENAGEQGYIVTITDTGRRYFVSENGKVEQMVPAPIVTHTINPETQVDEGEKITITINAEATEGEITKITKPDGSIENNVTTVTYEVEENGEYKFIVEQSNGGKTTYTVEITNGKYVEKFSDIYTSTQQYTKNGQTAWIPEGFAVGTSDTINSIENGLVITDAIDENHNSIGNEFVWVPVSKEDYNSQFKRRDGFYNNNSQTLTADFGEADNTGNNTDTRVTETETTKTEAQQMYQSVYDNEGFYIGRYEAGKDSSGNVVIQKGTDVYTNIPWSKNKTMNEETETTNTQDGAIELARNFDTENGYTTVTSTLCYGVQWDATLTWIDPNYTDFAKNSTGMGWYSDNYARGNATHQTGIDITGKTNSPKNIYDLAGNVYEWTMESYGTNYRVYRGGDYLHSGSNNPASTRSTHMLPSYSDSNLGFRVTLYLQS